MGEGRGRCCARSMYRGCYVWGSSWQWVLSLGVVGRYVCPCLGILKYIGGMKVSVAKKFSGVVIIGTLVHKNTFGGVQYRRRHLDYWMTL